MNSSPQTDWQSIFDQATLKADQLRPGVFYMNTEAGNDVLQNALIHHEARAEEARHQLGLGL